MDARSSSMAGDPDASIVKQAPHLVAFARTGGGYADAHKRFLAPEPRRPPGVTPR
jgi:hypothetical protein